MTVVFVLIINIFSCNFHELLQLLGSEYGCDESNGRVPRVPSADVGLCLLLCAGLDLWSKPGELGRHTEHYLASPQCVVLACGMTME